MYWPCRRWRARSPSELSRGCCSPMETKRTSATKITAGIDGGPRRVSRRREVMRDPRGERLGLGSASRQPVSFGICLATTLARTRTRFYHDSVSPTSCLCEKHGRTACFGCASATLPLHHSCSTGTLGQLVGKLATGHEALRARRSASVGSRKIISEARLGDGIRHTVPRRLSRGPAVGTWPERECRGMPFARCFAQNHAQALCPTDAGFSADPPLQRGLPFPGGTRICGVRLSGTTFNGSGGFVW